MTFRRGSALAFAALLALSACDSAEVGGIEAVQAVDTLAVAMGQEPLALRIGPYFRQTEGQPLTFEVESSSPTVSASVTDDTLWVEAVALGMAEVRLRVSDDAGHHLGATVSVRVVPERSPCFPRPGADQQDYFPIRLGNRWAYDYHTYAQRWYAEYYEETGELSMEVVGVDCSNPDQASYELERNWTGVKRSWNAEDPEGSEVIEPVSGSATWTLTESQEGLLALAHYNIPFHRYFEASAEAMQHIQIDFSHAGVGNLSTTNIDLERGVGMYRFKHSSDGSESHYSTSMELREAVLE